MSTEESSQEERYTCSDVACCPCIDLARERKQVEQIKGKKVYWFTKQDEKELGWRPGACEGRHTPIGKVPVMAGDKGKEKRKGSKSLPPWVIWLAGILVAVLAIWGISALIKSCNRPSQPPPGSNAALEELRKTISNALTPPSPPRK